MLPALWTLCIGTAYLGWPLLRSPFLPHAPLHCRLCLEPQADPRLPPRVPPTEHLQSWWGAEPPLQRGVSAIPITARTTSGESFAQHLFAQAALGRPGPRPHRRGHAKGHGLGLGGAGPVQEASSAICWASLEPTWWTPDHSRTHLMSRNLHTQLSSRPSVI